MNRRTPTRSTRATGGAAAKVARRRSASAGEPDLLKLYRTMLTIRRAEEKLAQLFADGEVPGFIHLSIGQEAVSAGVMSALREADTIASTHRGHGHAIAKGLALDGFFAEILGKADGLCRGRGGSMHVADFSVGMLGANGIVGAGISIALGSAIAHKTLRRDAIAVAFFGDGALTEGVLHECFNAAALWKLPLLLVCENNGWSEFQRSEKQVAFRLEPFAAAYGIAYSAVDGTDVARVAKEAGKAVGTIRNQCVPAVMECITHRFRGHYEGDAQKYRDAAEVERLDAKDPLRVAAKALAAAGTKPKTIRDIAEAIERDVADALKRARHAVAPAPSNPADEVYAAQGAAP